MSTLQVNTINAATSGQAVAVDVKNPRSFRNLIINGAMQVAQRGTSSTSAGYHTIDRWQVNHLGVTASPTQSQVDVASGTTPYTLGFRKALKITNANQGGVHNDALIRHKTCIEAQDMAKSGWDYTSTSSYITVSFWVKSSVAQNFYGRVQSKDGTTQNYPFETGSLTANTWTKITKTIPGASNISFDNDPNEGLDVELGAWYGTDFTSSGVSLNQWAAYASGTRYPDWTSTWYTTNAATLEITGVQLEVGSYATDFEHRSYGDELIRCKRYYQLNQPSVGYSNNTTVVRMTLTGTVEMRASPTLAIANGTYGVEDYAIDGRNVTALSSASLSSGTTLGGLVDATVATTTANKPHAIFGRVISLTAEL